MDATTAKQLPTVDAALFSWFNGAGHAEASDLPPIDERFLARGKRRTVEFRYAGASRSVEGELVAVRYRSCCGRFIVTVYND